MYGYEELASYTSGDIRCHDSLLGLFFYKRKDTDKVILAHEARIKELEAENERLKTEIWKMGSIQSSYEYLLRKENVKLRCTALHAMSELFGTKYIYEEPRRASRYHALFSKYYKHYRKAKAELKEKK